MGICCVKEFSEEQNFNATAVIKQENHSQHPSSDQYSQYSFLKRKSMKNKAPVIDKRNSESYTPDADSSNIQTKAKSLADCDLIYNSLNKHFVFKNLTIDQQDQIIETMKFYSLPPLTIVVEQGKPGNNFFVIASGECEVLVNEKRVNLLVEGNSFGEMALLTDKPRTATVKTLQPTTFWTLDRDTFRQAVKSINEANYEQNRNFIETVPIFQCLNFMQRELLLGAAAVVNFAAGQKIVIEGDSGSLFYLIKEGNVECKAKGNFIRNMGVGEYFGELALLYGKPRSATITACVDTKCLVIDGDNLTQALGSQLSQVIYRNSIIMAFDKSKVLNSLSSPQIKQLIDCMTINSFESGALVIPGRTRKKDNLFIVLKGKLALGGDSIYTEAFQMLDEEEFLKSGNEEFPDLVAVGQVDLASISSEDFRKVVGDSPESVAADSEILKVFKKISFLRGLSGEKMKALIKVLRIEEFEANSSIFLQNSFGDSFYIVKSGKVDIIKDDVLIRQINKFDYFGERSILFNEVRTATVKANNKAECWVLHKSDFFNIIDEQIRLRLKERIELQDDKITLDDLLVLKKLGSGMFGNVYLCTHKIRKNLYALKSIDRFKIENKKIQESLILERKILMQLDHSFILKLVKTFKDEKRIYFLMEYVRGQDLFDVIRKLGLLSDEDSKFYIACIIIIFEHLHERDIVYRDLKPENVMIDDEGYPKLIDFGTAKIVQGRTYTMIGTPHYMAPEVILGKGYGISADYWSIGIILFEFLCGGVPFGENESDNYSIYEKILEGKIVYPDYSSPTYEAKKFIEQLLNHNPALRIGGGADNLKTHVWFKSFQWQNVWDRKAAVPHKPKTPNFKNDIDRIMKNMNEEQKYSPTKENASKFQSDPSSWDYEF